MVSLTPGLQQSLLIQSQRRLLDKIGARVGTPVLYLKAAWSDPVLYGGRGERIGGDVDIVVRPHCFVAFARALEGEGFVRYREPWHVVTQRLVGKAWLYEPPRNGFLSVDLHRGLADRPWFYLPVNPLIDRAMRYASIDGPILSLAPEDQVVYAAAHYANHRYILGPQHLDDVVRLLRLHQVDWPLIKARSAQSGLQVPVALLTEALREQGIEVPTVEELLTIPARLRCTCTRRLFGSRSLWQHQDSLNREDLFFLMPLLSDHTSALPRYLARAAVMRSLDCAAELIFHVRQNWPVVT